MLRLLLLVGSMAAALAGRSPHADFIDQLVASAPSARYSNNIIEDALLDVPGLVAKYGYPIESHEVTTSDGYILTMHRIPHGRDQNNRPDPNKPVVFLMHGMLSSSADYLVLGPGNALGYVLAEEGYDVWLGNARGNFYSRRHTNLNPDSWMNPAFWRFSWDEIGNHDLPAFLDYIERHTGQKKLHYIGHSQGGTSFLVLNSLRPEYNAKFISFHGMAPAAFFKHNTHMITSLAPHIDLIEPAAFAIGRAEVFGNREFIEWFNMNMCAESSIFAPVCSAIWVSTTSDYFNTTMIPLFLGHSPAGSSIRQLSHYAQSINHHTFRRFDHNPVTNLITYGRRTPPDYDLSKVTAPAYIHYAVNDLMTNFRDVEILIEKLPNVKVAHLVDSPVFDHLDFVWGSGVKARLYDKMIGLMKEAERNAL
ncbi:lipase 3-like [Ostrinia furnacalis]|uniref:lipase 3-like n=1 Tax=Ostrinia furnacalis TaxID=93504 RepID=UPI00103F22A6|nr:lipase 3-like [Ostrinia furnacalis]